MFEKIIAHAAAGPLGKLGDKIGEKIGKKNEEKVPAPKPAKPANKILRPPGAKPAAASPTTGAAKPKLSLGFTGKETKFDSVVYAKLPENAKGAVTTLGFTPETWDDHGWPSSSDKWFEDLTAEERAAAETLGWDEASWDHKYENKNWADLPALVQKAATSAGFTQEMWDGDEWPEGLHTGWDELTDSQKQAMNVLGYHKWVWD
jgi:hypothetical protein